LALTLKIPTKKWVKMILPTIKSVVPTKKWVFKKLYITMRKL